MAKAASQSVPDASHRVVVLHGKESFLLGHHTQHLARSLEEAHGGLDRFQFDGNSVALADLLDELRTFGLMSTHKLVTLDSADVFLARDESFRRALERYVSEPVESATFLMRAETWRASKIDKLIAKCGTVIKLTAPTEAVATQWCIKRCASAHEAKLQSDAAALLVMRVGTDLSRLDCELEKLATLATGQNGTIDKILVAEMVVISREEQVWEIQAAVATGRPETALSKLRELLAVSRVPEQLVFWALGDLARKLHGASHMRRSGLPGGAAAKQLQIFGAGRQAILDAAGRISPWRAADLLGQIMQADRLAKTGQANPARTLETLVLQMTDTLRVPN